MAFNFFKAHASFCKLSFGCLLCLPDENMEDSDDLPAAVAVKSSSNSGSAFGPELKEAISHRFCVGKPELGSVIFQEIKQLIATGKQVDGPVSPPWPGVRQGSILLARALRLEWGLARPDPLGFRSEMSACVQPFCDLEHFFFDGCVE